MVLLLCVLLPAATVSSAAGRSEASRVRLVGTVITPPSRAADFTLTDQDGREFRMAGTAGKAVVLTFLYTHCTDTCPFLALKLKSAAAQLGSDADKVVFIAVTTDPERDTLNVTAAYSRAAGLSGTWHFLTGTPAAVKSVWKSFGIGVSMRNDEENTGAVKSGSPEVEHGQGLSRDDLTTASRVIGQFGGGYEVSHSAPFWIIDPRGFVRVLLDEDAAPADIVTDLRALLGS
jgi:protein SCO1